MGRRGPADVRPGFRLEPTANVSIEAGGRRLIGGSPNRILTLSPAGAAVVTRWFAGEPVGPERAHRELARRLVEGDLATATGGVVSPEADLVVVIPVKDDPDGLRATLDALGSSRVDTDAGSRAALRRIVIVDDGSVPAIDPLCGRNTGVPVTVLRRSTATGPGNARNLGTGLGDAPVTVFVDAGVVVTVGQLEALAAELSVGATVAVAPRVRSARHPSPLGRYEQRWSPLDLGPEPGLVGPGRRISYVPSTCLAVRTPELLASGGFDPDLRFGEDVDLVWRLRSRGWVRYVPAIEVTHPPRTTMAGFVRQRYRYGTAAGPLARRHGRAAAPARLDSRSAAAWTALLTGHRLVACVVAVPSTIVYAATLIRRGVSTRRAVRMVTAGWIGTGRGLALSMARSWWPLAVVAAIGGRFRGASYLLAIGWSRRLSWRRRKRNGAAAPATGDLIVAGCTDLAVGIVDDSAYALGVWRGALGARTAWPLLPDIPIGRGATAR